MENETTYGYIRVSSKEQHETRLLDALAAYAIPNHEPIPVMWAIPDEFIDITCREHRIRYQFDRQRLISDFLDYLHIIAR